MSENFYRTTLNKFFKSFHGTFLILIFVKNNREGIRKWSTLSVRTGYGNWNLIMNAYVLFIFYTWININCKKCIITVVLFFSRFMPIYVPKNLENTPAQVLTSYAELRESINKLPWKKLFWFVHTEFFYTIHFFSVRVLFFLSCHYSVYENFLQFLFIAVCWRFVRIKILLFFNVLYTFYISYYTLCT